MARPKSNGAYAKLSSRYYFDDAILAAGEQSEVMWTRCLAFLSSADSDGFITEMQMRSAIGIGLRSVPKRVEKLVEVGLLEHVQGGFVARSWLKWNKSAEEYGRHLAKDRERKARKDAEDAPNSARNPDSFRTDSAPQFSSVQLSPVQSVTPSSDADASDPGETFSEDVIRLCELLASLVHLNGNKAVVGKKWLQACDRLIRIDDYTPEQIEWVMRWSQQNEFWQSNILSMPKLREKFDQLKTRALTEKTHQSSPQTRTEQNLSVVAQYAAAEQPTLEITG
jgi:hypothetical protein